MEAVVGISTFPVSGGTGVASVPRCGVIGLCAVVWVVLVEIVVVVELVVCDVSGAKGTADGCRVVALVVISVGVLVVVAIPVEAAEVTMLTTFFVVIAA